MTLPQPEKRKRATPKQIAEILVRQNGRCKSCGVKLGGGTPYQIDHIHRLDALGTNEMDNLQALCKPCHKAKSKVDNREAKKGARIRGETGQRKRREERGSSIQSQGFQTNRNGRFKQKFCGKIVERTQ